MPDNPKLWNLYAKAREWQRGGMPMQEINKLLTAYTKGEIPGFASLEQRLGVHEYDDSRLGKLQGAASQVVEGLTFGHMGELGGAIAAANPFDGGLDYAGGREMYEAKREAHREAYPKSSLLGEASGAMAPIALTGGGATGSPAVGSVAQRALTGGGTGLITGAAGGAAYGHGAAQPGQRLEGTVGGGLAGGALGGTMGAAIPFLGGAARRFGLGALEQIPGAQRAADAVRNRFPARELANAELRGALEAADIPANELAPRMRVMPEGSVVADLDPALARQARAARNVAGSLERSGGPVRRIQARNLHRGERMAEAIRRDTRIPEVADPDTILEAARESWRATHLRPLQQANEEFGSMRLGKLFKDYPELKEYYRLNGGDLQKFKDEGKLTFGAAWDALQDMKNSIGSPSMRSTARENLIDASVAFEEMMEDAVPGFAESQGVYAALSRRYDAYKLGNKAMTKPGAELRVMYERLRTPNEQRAFREGLLDQIEAKLREEATGGATAAAAIRDRAAERVQKLRILFPDDASFDNWLASLANEDRWAITNGFLGSNSTTTAQSLDVGLGGYLTTGRAALNELLSVVFEDPKIRRQASEQVGQVLLAEGEEAAVALAMRLASQQAQQGGRAGITIWGGGQTGGTAARLLPPDNER